MCDGMSDGGYAEIETRDGICGERMQRKLERRWGGMRSREI